MMARIREESESRVKIISKGSILARNHDTSGAVGSFWVTFRAVLGYFKQILHVNEATY